MQETAPDFDVAVIDRLKVVLASKFPVLLDNFLLTMQRTFEQLDVCVQVGDVDQIHALAHKLVSSAGQFGLIRLSTLARTLEHEESRDEAVLAPLVADMKAEYARHLATLSALK